MYVLIVAKWVVTTIQQFCVSCRGDATPLHSAHDVRHGDGGVCVYGALASAVTIIRRIKWTEARRSVNKILKGKCGQMLGKTKTTTILFSLASSLLLCRCWCWWFRSKRWSVRALEREKERKREIDERSIIASLTWNIKSTRNLFDGIPSYLDIRKNMQLKL